MSSQYGSHFNGSLYNTLFFLFGSNVLIDTLFYRSPVIDIEDAFKQRQKEIEENPVDDMAKVKRLAKVCFKIIDSIFNNLEQDFHE